MNFFLPEKETMLKEMMKLLFPLYYLFRGCSWLPVPTSGVSISPFEQT